MCGATVGIQLVRMAQAGLSPRVRGNRWPCCPKLSCGRSIPACAGQPLDLSVTSRHGTVYPRVCGATISVNDVAEAPAGLSRRVRGNQSDGAAGGCGGGSIPACAGQPPFGGGVPSRGPVYPRVCGATTANAYRTAAVQGLSPRVRGNLSLAEPQTSHRRSIPACAGQPAPRRQLEGSLRVYPRVCGATRSKSCGDLPWSGLSPRVRGNRDDHSSTYGHLRSIPACAGQPAASKPRKDVRKVYPRVCGATEYRPVVALPLSGLSPRVRGNQIPDLLAAGQVGSIPACAGQPLVAGVAGVVGTVYPRVCGATTTGGVCVNLPVGLSPRVRGNQSPPEYTPRGIRSIPACAGQPLAVPDHQRVTMVYPRVCGATGDPRGQGKPSKGLSPRVRGNQSGTLKSRLPLRSIPACAGQPHRGDQGLGKGPVYPRVCGATGCDEENACDTEGLSPRVRGNPGRRRSLRRIRGSIPACAGQPRYGSDTVKLFRVYPRVCGATTLRCRRELSVPGLSPRVRGNPLALQ